MNVFILADSPHWIVNKCVDNMIANMVEYCFVKRYDQNIEIDEFVKIASKSDIIHFNSWEKIYLFQKAVSSLQDKCIILTIRSHRYNVENIRQFVKVCSSISVVNKQLVSEIKDLGVSNVVYIPDGIDDKFISHRYTPVIGFEGRPCEYKGNALVEQACNELGFEFRPAYGNISDMVSYYSSLDCYVCASENEGFSTGAMEAMAMNIPVLTVNVGVPKMLNVFKIDRSVEGIKKGLAALFAHNQVENFTWKNVCKLFSSLYKLSYAKKQISQDLLEKDTGVKF